MSIVLAAVLCTASSCVAITVLIWCLVLRSQMQDTEHRLSRRNEEMSGHVRDMQRCSNIIEDSCRRIVMLTEKDKPKKTEKTDAAR